MPYRIRVVQCTGCGRKMEGRFSPTPPHRCLRCTTEAFAGHLTDLHNHRGVAYAKSLVAGEATRRALASRSGPLYERWVAGRRAAAQRELDELGGTESG
jgi:hypothetical protein